MHRHHNSFFFMLVLTVSILPIGSAKSHILGFTIAQSAEHAIFTESEPGLDERVRNLKLKDVWKGLFRGRTKLYDEFGELGALIVFLDVQGLDSRLAIPILNNLYQQYRLTKISIIGVFPNTWRWAPRRVMTDKGGVFPAYRADLNRKVKDERLPIALIVNEDGKVKARLNTVPESLNEWFGKVPLPDREAIPWE